jgi:hypothetical protein
LRAVQTRQALRLFTGVSIALLVSVAASADTASAAPAARDFARGRINLVAFNTVSQANVDFSAESSATGTGASGTYKETFASSDPNFVVSGEVTCLKVGSGTDATGNVATIGGVVTKGGERVGVFDPATGTISPAQGFLLFTSDSGKFAPQPDTFQRQFTLAPVPPDGCGAPTPGILRVADGEVIIQNALP